MHNRLTVSIAVVLLPLIVVLVVGLVGRDDGAAPGAQSGGDQVRIVDFAFAPEDTRVAVGSTITWTNDDGFDHSVVADDDLFESKAFGQGGTFAFTFDRPGRFAYVCGIHNSMRGVVVVE